MMIALASFRREVGTTEDAAAVRWIPVKTAQGYVRAPVFWAGPKGERVSRIFNQIPVHGKGTSGAGLAATVSDITFLGNNIHVSTETATGEALSVRLPFGHEAIAGLNRGDIVHLDFDPGAAHVFC
ncbi:UNVERIFIED_ORG: hypothetical protein GGD47_001309 [Rhizobium etli]